MIIYLELPIVLQDTSQANLGIPAIERPATIKLRPESIESYRSGGTDLDHVYVVTSGGDGFLVTMSEENFERLLDMSTERVGGLTIMSYVTETDNR